VFFENVVSDLDLEPKTLKNIIIVMWTRSPFNKFH